MHSLVFYEMDNYKTFFLTSLLQRFMKTAYKLFNTHYICFCNKKQVCMDLLTLKLHRKQLDLQYCYPEMMFILKQ